jgi:hypothetical protein
MRMGGGLAGAVRPEEAENGAALDLHGEVAHHLPAAEGFGQAVHVDDDLGRGRRRVDKMPGRQAHGRTFGAAATFAPGVWG